MQTRLIIKGGKCNNCTLILPAKDLDSPLQMHGLSIFPTVP